MKRIFLALVLLVAFMFSLTTAAFASNHETRYSHADKAKWKDSLSKDDLSKLRERAVKDRLKVNGKLMKYDIPPVIKEGRTLIPIRAISNGMKADVQWDAENKKITITRGDIVVVLILGENKLLVNGEVVTMDTPAQLISNRTFVPLRFIAIALGDVVDHDPDTGDIDIISRLETPAQPTLAGNIATWSAVSNENNGYSLRLYRDGIEAAKATISHGAALRYDFTSAINKSGSYTVKVKALGTGDYRDSRESIASTPQVVVIAVETPTVPLAPTAPIVNDGADTFGWTFVPGFTSLAQYEYSVNSGTTWQACTANPQPLGNNAYAAGTVQVRVKADSATSRPAGIVLVSNAPFTTTTTVSGSIVALTSVAGSPSTVSIMHVVNNVAVTTVYTVLSTTQIFVNNQTADFSGLHLNDAVAATFQNNVLIKLEITR